MDVAILPLATGSTAGPSGAPPPGWASDGELGRGGRER